MSTKIDAPADDITLPILPKTLLDAIGHYGFAHADKATENERLHRWELLIAAIKDYARAQVRADRASTSRAAVPARSEAAQQGRPCTCHPDDSPPNPCAERYALAECRAAAQAETAQAAPAWCQCPACAPVAHASDCAVHNAPALPVGPCDCGAASGMLLLPREATKGMMVAAVKFANGPAVYKNVASAALDIEESIYGETWGAMVAAATANTPPQGDAHGTE